MELILLVPSGKNTENVDGKFYCFKKVFFYSVSIFEKAGLNNENSNWANLGLGAVSIIIASLSPYIMVKINRRPVVLLSAIFCGLFLILFMINLHFVVSFKKKVIEIQIELIFSF